MEQVLQIVAAFFGGILASAIGEWLREGREWEVARLLVAAELGENVIKAAGLLSGKLPVEDTHDLYATKAWNEHRPGFIRRMAVFDPDYIGALSGIYARLESLNRSGERPEPEFLVLMEAARRHLWGHRAGRVRTLYLRARTYRRRRKERPLPDWRSAVGYPTRADPSSDRPSEREPG